MSSSAHHEQFTVRSYEVSPNSLLRPVTLVRMLQETAWKHASLLGKGYADREGGELFWVLSRLRMRLDSLPQWGEQITVRTEPIGVEKLFALREFAVLDAQGQPLARALTGWLLVDSERGRPVRPGRLLADIPLGTPHYQTELSALPGPQEDANRSAVQPVRPHDIDQYGHVNNASYLEWVLDAVDGASPDAPGVLAPPVELSVNFIKETLPGDSYQVRWAGTAAGQTSAEVVRDPDGEPLCRIHIRSLR